MSWKVIFSSNYPETEKIPAENENNLRDLSAPFEN
jgi:hypothetical protein